MIAELSHFALFLALMASACQAVLPLYGIWADARGRAAPYLAASGGLFALVAAGSVLFAFAGLVWSFVVSDVSTLTSISASSLTILPISLTGRVIEPFSETSALREHLAPRSKFVVVNLTKPS